MHTPIPIVPIDIIFVPTLLSTSLSRISFFYSWRSLVARDEGSYLPTYQTNVVMSPKYKNIHSLDFLLLKISINSISSIMPVMDLKLSYFCAFLDQGFATS